VDCKNQAQGLALQEYWEEIEYNNTAAIGGSKLEKEE
jgi:hypothetical protein